MTLQLKDRWIEFFEENKILSMARLSAFIATAVVATATLICLAAKAWDSAIQFGGMLCGLGGFNYAFSRGTSAYQTVRMRRTEEDDDDVEIENKEEKENVSIKSTK